MQVFNIRNKGRLYRSGKQYMLPANTLYLVEHTTFSLCDCTKSVLFQNCFRKFISKYKMLSNCMTRSRMLSKFLNTGTTDVYIYFLPCIYFSQKASFRFPTFVHLP